MNTLKEFIISESKWLHGDDKESFLLRESDGKMCCLGFFALQCNGLMPCEINNVGALNYACLQNYKTQKIPSEIENHLMAVNDSNINKTNKKSLIEYLFKQAGYKVIWEV